jgi:predicted ester cyclase
MSAEINKETARRFVHEVCNQHLLESLQELADPDFINHDPKGHVTQGVQNLTGFRTAISDLSFTITQILAEGDFVALQWTAEGTHQQSITHMTPEFAGPASGNSLTVTGMWLFRFDGPRIAEVWNHWDRHHLLGQISAE